MVRVLVSPETERVYIAGYRLRLEQRFELSRGVAVEPGVPAYSDEDVQVQAADFGDWLAAMSGKTIGTICVVDDAPADGEERATELAARAWNALWVFGLLSLACRAPCESLTFIVQGPEPNLSAAHPGNIFRPHPNPHHVTEAQLEWAREHFAAYHTLSRDPTFSSSLRCYRLAHGLSWEDTRVMLLWAGIEGLFDISTEISHRLALYSALTVSGTPEEKRAFYKLVKGAYSTRSKVVHGNRLEREKLPEAYRTASDVLVSLLARCVELGRVPSTAELDALAVSANLN